jgi:C4-dicarboxylate transporter DctQ subunit
VEGLIILCATVVVSIVTTEVILRYIFSHSLIFTEELARYLMVWIVFLGAALAVRDGSHIKISMVVKHFHHRQRRFLEVLSYCLVVVFLVILTVEGIKILPRQLYQMCITIDTCMFYFYLAIPVGSVLMIIFLLPHIRDAIKGNSRANGTEEERKE